MTARECELIGKAMAKELYRLYTNDGIPQGDLITSDEACKLLNRSKSWLYAHQEIPHYKRRYSRSAILAYINR